METTIAMFAMLYVFLGLVAGQNDALLEEMKSPALIEAAPVGTTPTGGAWIDVDEDGDLDFVLPGDPTRGLHLQLLRNVDTGRSFAAEPLDSKVQGLPDALELKTRTQVLAADFNNDGKTDLYLSGCTSTEFLEPIPECSTGVFFENLGDGAFKMHENTGLGTTFFELGSSAGDVNGDGLLDLYISDALPAVGGNTRLVGIHTSKLYINEGDFQFRDSGLAVDNPATCVSAFVDYDGDGDQDLVTASCNLLESNDPEDPSNLTAIPGPLVLFRNTLKEAGELGFEDATEDVFGKLDGGFWMGVSMTDLNADGMIDFYVGNLGVVPGVSADQHLLLVSQSDGTYVNESVTSGVSLHGFNWGSAFIDVDNDGDDDLVTVGSLFASGFSFLNPGVVFRNNGSGNFKQAQDLGLEGLQTSGLAVADFDEDGSQDVMIIGLVPPLEEVVEAFPDNGRLVLLKGTATPNRHVSFRLEGVESNSAGIGAFVTVCPSLEIDMKEKNDANKTAAVAKCQMHVSTAGSSFASTHSPIFHFGIEDGVERVDVNVVWPSGEVDEHLDVGVGFRYLLKEGADSPVIV